MAKIFNTKILLAKHESLGQKRADDKAYRGRNVEQFHLANLKHCIRQCRKGKWVRRVENVDGEIVTTPIKTLGEAAFCCGEMKISCKLAIAQSGLWDTPIGDRLAATKVSQWTDDNEISYSTPANIEQPSEEMEAEEVVKAPKAKSKKKTFYNVEDGKVVTKRVVNKPEGWYESREEVEALVA